MTRLRKSLFMSVATVQVRFFASVREAAGVGSCEVRLPEEASLEDLLRLLRERFPQLSDSLVGIGIALNRRYVSREGLGTQLLREGDEVALIPPISGG